MSEPFGGFLRGHARWAGGNDSGDGLTRTWRKDIPAVGDENPSQQAGEHLDPGLDLLVSDVAQKIEGGAEAGDPDRVRGARLEPASTLEEIEFVEEKTAGI